MKRFVPRLGPEHDTSSEPGSGWRPYIVCSTPRSGSQLLCRGLATSGVAGVPLEYFNLEIRAPLAERWCCGASLSDYVRALRAHRTTPDGVFGTKLHWGQLESIRAESLERPAHEPPFTLAAGFLDSLFPDARYVYIRRLDVNRQAVSRWLALHSDVWEVGSDEPEPSRPAVRYSFSGIERHRRQIVLGDLHWDRYFRLNGIRPKEVLYEDLVEDYERVMRGVLDHLVPGAGGADIAPPETRPLADTRTEDFSERFARDLVRRGVEGPNISERLADRIHRLAAATLTR